MTLQIIHDGKFEDYYLSNDLGTLGITYYTYSDEPDKIRSWNTAEEARSWALENLNEAPSAEIIEYRSR